MYTYHSDTENGEKWIRDLKLVLIIEQAPGQHELPESMRQNKQKQQLLPQNEWNVSFRVNILPNKYPNLKLTTGKWIVLSDNMPQSREKSLEIKDNWTLVHLLSNSTYW